MRFGTIYLVFGKLYLVFWNLDVVLGVWDGVFENLQRKLIRQEVPAIIKVQPTAVGLCSPSVRFSLIHSKRGLQVGKRLI